MAWYQCIQSGNKVEFTSKIDIESMKRHNGYVLLEDEPEKKVEKKKSIFTKKEH